MANSRSVIHRSYLFGIIGVHSAAWPALFQGCALVLLARGCSLSSLPRCGDPITFITEPRLDRSIAQTVLTPRQNLNWVTYPLCVHSAAHTEILCASVWCTVWRKHVASLESSHPADAPFV